MLPPDLTWRMQSWDIGWDPAGLWELTRVALKEVWMADSLAVSWEWMSVKSRKWGN